MGSTMLSDAELLLIEQLCREGELHCAQRASRARHNDDYPSASYENALKDQYRALRRKVARLLEVAVAEAGAMHSGPPAIAAFGRKP